MSIDNEAISEETYKKYLKSLLQGEHRACRDIVADLVERRIPLKTLYLDLFRRSMYEVGDLWCKDEITVATEHMATATTESVMSLAYPLIFRLEHGDHRAMVTCVQGEYHQIGARMVADFLEMWGWHTFTFGANTPRESLLSSIGELRPDVLALSATMSFNLPLLDQLLQSVYQAYPDQDIIVGGHAFMLADEKYQPASMQQRYPNLLYINELAALEQHIKGYA